MKKHLFPLLLIVAALVFSNSAALSQNNKKVFAEVVDTTQFNSITEYFTAPGNTVRVAKKDLVTEYIEIFKQGNRYVQTKDSLPIPKRYVVLSIIDNNILTPFR